MKDNPMENINSLIEKIIRNKHLLNYSDGNVSGFKIVSDIETKVNLILIRIKENERREAEINKMAENLKLEVVQNLNSLGEIGKELQKFVDDALLSIKKLG